MKMYLKLMVVLASTMMFLLLIFSHLDWRQNKSSFDQLTMRSIEDKTFPSNPEQTVPKPAENDLLPEISTKQESLRFQSAERSAEKSQSKSSTRAQQPTRQQQRQKTEMQAHEILKRQEEQLLEQLTFNFAGSSYPWFSDSWQRGLARQSEAFVGDRPLFPACPHGRRKDSLVYSFIDAKNYLPDSKSKNPCWYEDPVRQRSFRCLPYFYIAGVAKCGTTDLYRRLVMHPDILRGFNKEYHFWDRERFGNVEITESGEVLEIRRKPWTFKQYTDLIVGPRGLPTILDDIKYYGKSDKIFGDGSPSYLWDILNWQLLEGNQGCKEPRVVIGQHIRHIHPQAKMVLIFRHPTPRLYSRFLSRIWRTSYLKNADAEMFHNLVERGVKVYRECFKRWSVRQCAYNYTLYDDVTVRLVEGMYPIFMADWLRVWPREQMLMLRNEDYGADLKGTLQKVFDFLDVAPVNGTDWERLLDEKKSNAGQEYDKIGSMKPETAKILDEFYQPFVDRFADLLQDRRFLWKDTYPPVAGQAEVVQYDDETTSSQTPVTYFLQSAAEPSNLDAGLPSPAAYRAAGVPSPAAGVPSPAHRAGAKAAPGWVTLFLTKFHQKLNKNVNASPPRQLPIVRIEQAPGVPMTKARYPSWWWKGLRKTATSMLGDQFMGDHAFFPPCSSQPRPAKFQMLEPRNYISNSKNPCWYKDPQLRTDLRCLPYFYVIGVAKSGTSDLYRRLRLHPDVTKGAMKEYHWWDRGRYGHVYTDHLPLKTEQPKKTDRVTLKEYSELITGKQGIELLMEDLNNTGSSSRIFGDISPSYFNDMTAWSLLAGNEGCNEPRVTIGQHIRHLTPKAKIILLVRHPTPRLYLRFLSRVPEIVPQRRMASFAFHLQVKKSVNRYKACFERWSIRHCAYNATLYHKDKVKLWEGMYSVFLADWLRVFPRQQIHVIRYRDLVRDTATVLNEVFHFLHLPALKDSLLQTAVAEKWSGRRAEHELRRQFGPMVPETIDLLNDFYEPFVDKFAEMLNDERLLWRDTDHL